MSDEALSRAVLGLQPVAVGNRELYDIEMMVVAATPNVLDTGTPEEFVTFLNKGGIPSVYIEYNENGEQVGYLALNFLDDSDAMEVRSIAVKPRFQHHGYGRSMMTEAERIAKQGGRKRVTLVTSPENTDAMQFYTNLGYSITDTVDNYYGDGTSRHILEKKLQ